MLLFLLVAMTAAAPLTLQIFLPALPVMQKAFAVAPGVAQLSLSLAILANAVATLAYGPLSDRYGRRPVLLAGLLLFIVGSVACALAPQIGTLVVARVLQAMGAAAGMVLARAIIRDLYDTEQAASAIAYLTMAMVVAPMVAPSLGALLIEGFGWRAVFVATAVVALLLTGLTLACLVETRRASAAHAAGASLFAGAGALLTHRLFLRYLLQSSFAIGMFFSFLAGAPYYMLDILGRSATDYGLYFILVSGAFMVGNFASARLVRRVGMHRLIAFGSWLSLASMALGVCWLALGEWTPLALFGPMTAAGFGNGLSISNAMAGAVSVDPDRAGSASGLCGSLQMLLSAAVSQVVGMLQDGTPYPTIAFMFTCALLSVASFTWLQPRVGRRRG